MTASVQGGTAYGGLQQLPRSLLLLLPSPIMRNISCTADKKRSWFVYHPSKNTGAKPRIQSLATS